MNKFLVLGRSNISRQEVDLHAAAQFRCDMARLVRRVTSFISW